MYAVTLGVGLGCIGDRELDRDDSKRRHSFCQIGIAHGVGHSYSYGYRLASGIYGPRPKLGHSYSFSQVSIGDMEQGQSWGTVQFQSG